MSSKLDTFGVQEISKVELEWRIEFGKESYLMITRIRLKECMVNITEEFYAKEFNFIITWIQNCRLSCKNKITKVKQYMQF